MESPPAWEARIEISNGLYLHFLLYVATRVGGEGFSAPGIIKFNFWRMVREWKNAKYICINAKEAYAPEEIKDSSICIQADIGEVLKQFKDSGA